MDAGPRPSDVPRAAGPWRAFMGPALTLVLIAAIEALRTMPLALPGPGVLLVIAVAGSTYVGGFVPGAVSCALAIGYGAWYFLMPPSLGDPVHVRRLVDLSVGAIGIAVMMGVLRRRAERARRETAEAAVAAQYGVLFEEAGEPMLLSDASHRYVFVNRRACELSGYAREELLRMRVTDLVSARSQAERPLRLEELRKRGELRGARELVRRDGTTLKVEVAARRLPDGSTLAILRDVTEERESVERLQQALSLVQATLESTADGLLVVDGNGRWAGYNRKFGEVWGLSPEALAEGDDKAALAHAMSLVEDPEAFQRRVSELYDAPEESGFDEIRFKDGRVFERYSIPQRIGDRVVGRVWSFRDVTTARRQAEVLRSTQQRLLHTEKMEAVGRLAGGVAHDFNNMLTAILGEADFLLLSPELDERVRGQIKNIRSAALRSAALTRQLLAYARCQHTEPRPLAMRELVVGLEPLIQRLAGRSVTTRLELPEAGQGPWVHADPTQLEQAILNLVINAGDAMPDGGELVLRLGEDHVAAGELARRGGFRAGRHARLSVIDTGCGIPAEARPHLFEPFFTTKPPGKGTGLGLASVHGIVEQAQGLIEFESEVGRGSAFHILIPAHDPQATAPRQPASVDGATPAGSGARRPALVLVVDDEDQVRSLVVAVLQSAGYRVQQAANGADAMALARAATESIELLLSDVVMPGTSGPALARALIAEGRVRRVMFMSGFPGTTLREHLHDLNEDPLLQKPFRPDDLLERVRAMLGTHGS